MKALALFCGPVIGTLITADECNGRTAVLDGDSLAVFDEEPGEEVTV